MKLVVEPKTKEDWLKEFAPDYKPMDEDVEKAAIDALDMGIIRAPKEIRLGTREEKINFIEQLPIEARTEAIAAMPKSIEMCRICKSNCETRRVAWPPCGDPLLNKQFQYDVMAKQGLLDDASEDERYQRLLEMNPVLWAESEFTFTNKKGEKKAWSARWYQEIFLLCSNLDRSALWGRRMGKSESMIILALHAAAFRPGASSQDREYGIHVFAHSETLQEKHYREFMRFIENSKTLKGLLAERGSKKDSLILFKNGSSIAFHVISGKQRGLSGKLIWFDEAAFYQDEGAIAAALGLRLEESGEIAVIMTSNSSGFRGRFYRFSHKGETFMMQLSAHYNPDWSRKMELLARSEFTDEEYELEVEAKWGEAKSAVFSPRHIDTIEQLYSYSYLTTQEDNEHLYISTRKGPGCFRVLGCDWNEGMNGVHFVIVEYNPYIQKEHGGIFRVIHKSIITGDEWSHQAARNEAFDLIVGWGCDAAFMDWGGGGSMSVPDVKRMLGSHGYGHMVEHIVAIDMSKTVDVPDPFQPDMTYKVPYKNVMVKQTQRLLQQHRLGLPVEEFDGATPKLRARNIVPQMRDYKVERTNAKGQAVYSSDIEEHTLTAYMLAVMGCIVSCTDILVPDFETPPARYAPLKEQLPSAKSTKKGKKDNSPIAVARNPKHSNPFQTGLGGIGLGSRTNGLSPRRRRTW